jgi:threonine/homoserine/homoserine lactone efflux protein
VPALDLLMMFFLKGIGVGLVIAVPVGPVGVLCVRRTIFEGRLFGFVSGLGAASADTVFGIVAGFGLTVVSDWLLGWQGWLRAAGGLFLLWIGVAALRKRVVATARPARSANNLAGAYLSTFALTISNPVTILAFLGVFAALGFSGHQATLPRAGMLVAGVLAGSLLWWAGLSLGTALFRERFTERHLLWLNRISGLVLTLSGLLLLASLAFENGG